MVQARTRDVCFSYRSGALRQLPYYSLMAAVQGLYEPTVGYSPAFRSQQQDASYPACFRVSVDKLKRVLSPAVEVTHNAVFGRSGSISLKLRLHMNT